MFVYSCYKSYSHLEKFIVTMNLMKNNPQKNNRKTKNYDFPQQVLDSTQQVKFLEINRN